METRLPGGASPQSRCPVPGRYGVPHQAGMRRKRPSSAGSRGSPPEVDIRQNDIHTAHSDAWCEVLIAHQAHVGRERNWDRFPNLAHAFEVRGWILQILQIDLLIEKPSAHPNRRLNRPG